MQTFFFVMSKIVWALLKPETLVFLCIALTFVFVWRGRTGAAKTWATVSLLSVAAIGALPLGGWALYPLESQYPASPDLGDVDGIIVLGGGEKPPAHRQPQVTEGGERFIEAMALARRFPDAAVIYSGGSGALSDVGKVTGVHARSAELFFAAMGLDASRLTIENASRNTAENAAMSFALASPQEGQTWVLVTSAFHMPRAMRSFRRAGWTGLVAWPADFRARRRLALGWDIVGSLGDLNVASKEYVGLLAYGVTGR